MRHFVYRGFAFVGLAFMVLSAGWVSTCSAEYEWSLRKGVAFDADHPDGSLRPAESNTISDIRHISAIRVTTGDGLDVVTFDYSQVSKDCGVVRWAETAHADNLIYKYSPKDQEYIRSGEPQPDKLVADNRGADRGSHPLVIARLEPEDRLQKITVYSPAGKSFAISGLTLHIVSLKGGSRDVTIHGAKWSENDPHTDIGKDGSEIIQMKIFFGKALDALGVSSRPIDKDK